MNQTLHPVMAAALAPFTAGLAPAPFVNPPLRHLRRSPPLQSFVYELSGVTLACEVEYEAAERQTRDCPGSPESAILWTAKTESGDDVTEILGDDQRAEIEEAFLCQEQEY